MSRYVDVNALKPALRGKEAEIVGKVVPSWRGEGHTRCPYPAHEDKNPSWRFDPKSGRAFCTCLAGRSHSVFDVVMAIQGLDFMAAAVLIAEAIGRTDLIKEARERRQQYDPESLLNPSPENRDDGLPAVYLGARLDIEPGDVVLPATRAVGHKLL